MYTFNIHIHIMIKLVWPEPITERLGRKFRYLMPERTLHDMQTERSKQAHKK